MDLFEKDDEACLKYRRLEQAERLLVEVDTGEYDAEASLAEL